MSADGDASAPRRGRFAGSSVPAGGRGSLLTRAVAVVILSGLAWLSWKPLVAGVVSLQADRARARRDFDRAVDLFGRLEALDPHAARTAFELGRALRRRGDLIPADTRFTRALERGWDRAEVATQRLLAEAQCGDIKDVEPAIESLVAAGAGDEIAEECYEAIVQGYLNCMRPEKAAECLDYWSRWQPRNPLVAYWRGRMHEQAEEWATALAHYRSSLELAPWRYATLIAVARMERETAAVEAASVRYADCRSRRPDDPVAALGLADCRLRLGDREGGARLLRETLTLELSPDEQAAALANLAELALEDGRDAAAAVLAAQAAGIDPRNPRCRLVHAAVLARLGQTAAAEEERKVGRELGHRQVALAEAARRARVNPESADIRAEVGSLLLGMGLGREAARWFDTALQIDPRHRASHEALADYWESVGDGERAAPHRSAAVAAEAAAQAADGTDPP